MFGIETFPVGALFIAFALGLAIGGAAGGYLIKRGK